MNFKVAIALRIASSQDTPAAIAGYPCPLRLNGSPHTYTVAAAGYGSWPNVFFFLYCAVACVKM